MSIEEDILKKIRPSETDVARIQQAADSLMLKVKEYIKKNDIDVTPMYVGSFAKGTFLSDPDLDLFLLFPESTGREDLMRLGLRIGEDVINGERLYAEHPYIRGWFMGVEVDMVPCYNISSTEHLLSAVDRSPFHFRYVSSKTDEHMRDEIRLMKRFMKGIGTYGAEPNVRGFSGYMCELLTIHYGGFLNALKAASEWKAGVTIVMEKRGPPMVAPLVLYDPVDASRNVASAIHLDTLSEFIVAAKRYLEGPSERFFFPNKRIPLERDDIRSRIALRGTRMLTIAFDRPNINEDNLYAQVWRTQYAIEKKLGMYSFNVVKAVHMTGEKKIYIVFELERDTVSRTHKHSGPPVWVKSSESFLSKWKDNIYGDPFIEEGCWTVIADRQYFSASEMVYNEIKMAGIGKEIDISSMEILGNDDSIDKADIVLLSELLEPKHRWEF